MSPFWTVGETLRHGIKVLAEAGVENPALDARLLLGHVMSLDGAALLRDRSRPAPMEAYTALLARRAAREPVALILGRQEFWSLDFAVSPATLIPRADSETLVEAVIAARPEREGIRRVLDLGTGTGCLLLAVLTEFSRAWGIGVDVHPAAAALASGNAMRLGLNARASFIVGNWTAALTGQFDVVLSNPPYIPSGDIAALMPEVALFESRRALDGGRDGLGAYRALLECLPLVLAPDGLAVFELGAEQGLVIRGLAEKAGYWATLRRDYGGVERALVIEMEKKVGKNGGAH